MSNPDTASVWMFQDRGGNWKPFHDEQHRRLTIESGAWIVREFRPVATEAAAMAATVPHEKLTHEIDMVLTDPDTKLSPGAVRALQWCRTWVSVPLQLAQAPVAGQPAEPSPACGGVPDPRCDYLATCGRVCMKCGRVHAPMLFSTPLPARWGSYAAARADPVFQVARSIMGTENDSQDRQLLKAISHVLAAPKGDSNG